MINTLINWKKSTPISTEHHTDPALFIHHTIDKAMDEFYNYIDIINSKTCFDPGINLQEAISKNLVVSIKVAIASSDT